MKKKIIIHSWEADAAISALLTLVGLKSILTVFQLFQLFYEGWITGAAETTSTNHLILGLFIFGGIIYFIWSVGNCCFDTAWGVSTRAITRLERGDHT